MNRQKSAGITVFVTYANYAFPVPNARITVNSGGHTKQYLSNSEGKSENIVLPQGVYDVTVCADGFFDRTFLQVNVDEDVELLLNAELFPLYTV